MKADIRTISRSAVIAAAYAALSAISSMFGLAYGPVQFRLSEALCVLPRRYPSAVAGVFLGCLLTNILSPYGLLDLVVGSLTTLLAALWSSRCRTDVGAAVPPVLLNALFIGILIAWQETGSFAGGAFFAAFAANAFSVGLGQAVVCFGVGVPLLRLLAKYLHD
ncbi:MAG: QueT transporter family protein [Oscillospiraceae bacterium]|nr:QueT transporter family protein [Oscillospiraceae bacterium]